MEKACEDRDKDWNDASIYQGLPATTRSQEEARKDPAVEQGEREREGAGRPPTSKALETLASDFWPVEL